MAATRGVVFTEDVVKIAGQQGCYAVGHGLVSTRHLADALHNLARLLNAGIGRKVAATSRADCYLVNMMGAKPWGTIRPGA